MVHQRDEALDMISPVPGKKQKLDESPSPTTSSLPQFQLTNEGENLCFTNSVVRLLGNTEVKEFLVTDLPIQPDPALSTAQELARIYRAQGRHSAAQLRRYIYSAMLQN